MMIFINLIINWELWRKKVVVELADYKNRVVEVVYLYDYNYKCFFNLINKMKVGEEKITVELVGC